MVLRAVKLFGKAKNFLQVLLIISIYGLGSFVNYSIM